MDLLAFSHLRWDFVFQRPNHLLTRAARSHRVFLVEEPVRDAERPHVQIADRDGVHVVVPHIRPDSADEPRVMRFLLDRLVEDERIARPLLWYYTPMALRWTAHLLADARLTVYDCMDHLAGFVGAPSGLLAMERRLMASVNLVFTGGRSLFEAKRGAHDDVHCFPSSVDVGHFQSARAEQDDPADQRLIPSPRIGYFGVLDERIDWELIRDVAERRPDLHFVLVGPTAKVDLDALPKAANIHYLGSKPYEDLPRYLAGWDVAMMPFARNEATRYISPTKTPEYLAGGRPVASTSIRDVVHPYGTERLVHIGDTPDAFLAAIEKALAQDVPELLGRADAFLARGSWDHTWSGMQSVINKAIHGRIARTPPREAVGAPVRAARPPRIARGMPQPAMGLAMSAAGAGDGQ